MGYLHPPGKDSIAAYSGGKVGFAENKRFGRKHKSGWCVWVWKEKRGEKWLGCLPLSHGMWG